MPSERDTRAALHLWVALNRASASIYVHLHQQVEAHGLTLTEFGVLEALLHKGPLPLGEIGDLVLLTSGSMTYVVDKLERRNLLQRRRSQEDRRVLYAELTPEGETLIQAAFAEHAALLGDLMTSLTRGEKREAAALLGRLRQAADAHPDGDPSAENPSAP